MDARELYCAIKQQHERLKEEVQRLRVAARSRPDYMSEERWRALAMEEAGRLRDSLTEHFRLEEVGGYLDAVTEKRPGLTPTVRKLHAQHGRLLAELEQVDQACRRGAALDEIERLALAALDLLQKHEFAEADLIQEALGADLGTCD